MKKSYLLAAMAFMLVSCSQDETIEINRENDVIQFGVVTDAAGRVATEGIFCNNNMPGFFNVWATYDGKTYIDGDMIIKEGTSAPYTWKNTTAVRYWPAGEVTFYAHVNAGEKFKWNETGVPTIENYTVDTDLSIQEDLLYAVKKASAGTVGLNFRHALSQIVFQAKNTNDKLRVVIDGVSICNLGKTNTFTYPKTTDVNVIDHNSTGNVTIGTQGTWNELKGGNIDYSVNFEAVTIDAEDNEQTVSLTNTNDTDKEYSSNALLLLPHTATTAWDPTEDNGKPADQSGTYFLVKCAIYNIATGADGQEDVTCLWGEKDNTTPATYKTKNVAIPASFTWEQGKKYIYTFVFGEGNGGYNPEPDGIDPEPVLTPITFNVTVDDFVPVTESETEMKTNN